tara:strand:- start:983 stop:1357 length:375 start_codon:yes stop_codon:yes gene_type:complete
MSKLNLETVQWSSLKDIDEVEPINDKDHEVLSELKEILLKHGYINRFGVTLLHRHFDIAQDEIIMENTDTEARVSVLSVEKDCGGQSTIETMWKFADGPHAVTQCVLRCHYFLGHKQRHKREGS